MAPEPGPRGLEIGALPDVVVFPAFSALITLVCAGVIARDALARPRPDKIAWAIAFAIFAVAAGVEVLGSLTHWTPALAKVYYLTGAVLVVGYLALGELYLLAAGKIHRFAPGVTLLVTAISATVVWNAKVDESKLASDGWEAIERGTALKALAIGINSIGTVVIVGGLIYSAWHFKRLGIHRNRMIGCLLIALGTIVVGMGGTLTRFGHREYLYIAMAIGAAIIFAGYLETKRQAPSPKPLAASAEPQAASSKPQAIGDTPADVIAPTLAVVNRNSVGGEPVKAGIATNGHHPPPASALAHDPGIAFIEERLRDLDEAGLSELCRVWSASRPDADAFQRDEARRTWALRLQLSAEAQCQFDALSVPTRLQLTELYHEVTKPLAGSR